MSENTGWVIAGIAAVAAFMTNPTLEQYQKHVQTLISSARQNALSSGEISTWLKISGFSAGLGGRYENNYLFSQYHITFAGQKAMVCTGAFGQISCGVK